ncbi:uncharacterized protein LOC113753831 [Coffea eugenioides]|uniref:uncharacterized protein LOC113753831 n=1 Tax=Coffea eugenioides TaxID=49369 RepID=UPI000F60E9E5|nr:uncharacterized protein LOC113753831 [Coffea eugenioides]
MTSKKTFASPIFIFYWLLMISIVLVQPALSGRTLGSGGRMIGVDPSSAPAPGATGGSSPTNSGSKPGAHGSPGYRALQPRPICNKVRYANCIRDPPEARPCGFQSRCSRHVAPSPPAPK